MRIIDQLVKVRNRIHDRLDSPRLVTRQDRGRALTKILPKAGQGINPMLSRELQSAIGRGDTSEVARLQILLLTEIDPSKQIISMLR